MSPPKRNLELIDASPWLTSLAEGRFEDVIRGAQKLRLDGVIGAFHLELLGHVGTKTPDSHHDAQRLLETLVLRDLYDRAPELLEAKGLWIDTTAWFLQHEFGKKARVCGGRRVEDLILGELGLVRSHTSSEETAAFKALALIKQGHLEAAFDFLFEASRGIVQPLGEVFRRVGHKLFQTVPRQNRLDVLRYKRGQEPCAYGLAPFPGHGFLLKEYVGTAKLGPIITAAWIEGWTLEDGFPVTEDFARVESLLVDFSRAS